MEVCRFASDPPANMRSGHSDGEIVSLTTTEDHAASHSNGGACVSTNLSVPEYPCSYQSAQDLLVSRKAAGYPPPLRDATIDGICYRLRRKLTQSARTPPSTHVRWAAKFFAHTETNLFRERQAEPKRKAPREERIGETRKRNMAAEAGRETLNMSAIVTINRNNVLSAKCGLDKHQYRKPGTNIANATPPAKNQRW